MGKIAINESLQIGVIYISTEVIYKDLNRKEHVLLIRPGKKKSSGEQRMIRDILLEVAIMLDPKGY